MSAGPATSRTAAAMISSSVMAVMPWPTRPVSVSISVRHSESDVCLFRPTTSTVTGMFSGVALTRTIFKFVSFGLHASLRAGRGRTIRF
jgi:hypothetical protein